MSAQTIEALAHWAHVVHGQIECISEKAKVELPGDWQQSIRELNDCLEQEQVNLKE